MQYEDLMKLTSSLWPNWRATPQQATEYRSRLESRNPRWLEAAIRDHYSLDCPKDGTFLEPRLSKILQRYAAIAEAGSADERAASSGQRYRAAWVERRNGRPCAMASAQTFQTRTQAMDHAAARGDTPDAIAVGEIPGADDMDDVMREDRVMRNALCRLPADALESVCVKAMSLPLGITKESVAPHPIEWKRFVVGCVHSVGERMGVLK